MENQNRVITREDAVRVLEIVDQGLSFGLGNPVPGQMCVEAAVCYALSLPHNDDDPFCVSPALRALKIRLNDANWPDNKSRAKGMRKLTILQLGTKDILNEKEFINKVTISTVKKLLPEMFKQFKKNGIDISEFEIEINACKKVKTRKDAREVALAIKYKTNKIKFVSYTAYAAAYADAATAKSSHFHILTFFAEMVSEILIEMNVPAIQWLDLLKK